MANPISLFEYIEKKLGDSPAETMEKVKEGFEMIREEQEVPAKLEENYHKIFPMGIMDVGKPLSDCHYSQGGKYICICESKICKKQIKR